MRRNLMTLAGFIAAASFAQISLATGGETFYLDFDGEGVEEGITGTGATDFQIHGSTWTGGRVAEHFTDSKYAASGLNSFEIRESALVVFDKPIISLKMFFVFHDDIDSLTRAGVAPYTEDNIKIGHHYSRRATFFNDPFNYAMFEFEYEHPIKELRFFGATMQVAANGFVDNVCWTTVPAPGAVGAFGVAGLAAFARRRR